MKTKKLPFFFFAYLASALFVQCQTQSSTDPILALLFDPPIISSVTPQIGTPAQNNLNGSYGATEVTIKGENFGLNTVIRFNETKATILANLGNELHTLVPEGAYSGLITVSKSGGSCLPGQKTGVHCTGTDFFVDCYAVTNKQYGEETEIKQGESKSITFDGVETKAFRTSVITGSASITIGCDSIITLRVFNRSCQATDYILQKDPTVIIPGGISTQFYMTAGSSTCGITI